MNIKEFADKFIKVEDEAWMKGNVDALDEVEHTDVVYHPTPPKPDVVGREAHKQIIVAARKAFSDIKFEIKYLAGEGNLFALSYKARYISNGKVPGLPPAGKEVTSDALFLFRLKDGKIIELWSNGITTGLT